MDIPLLFRCPISMEIMKDPVTICTGVTYERKNIEKWLFFYKKMTCPATMQRLDSFDLTPNHTLKRLISTFRSPSPSPPPSPSTTSSSSSVTIEELASLLHTIKTSPFKVNSLKKLKEIVAMDDKIAMDLVKSGGIDILCHVVDHVSVESNDFSSFRACSEAVGVLHHLPLSDAASIKILTTPECMTSMITLLQHGSSDARLHTVTILQKITRTSKDWCRTIADQNIELYKSLLELLSDDISSPATSAAIDVLIEILTTSKRRCIRAVEAGAACVLIEILPDANRYKCERLLLLLKLLCECPEGRSAVSEHGMGVAVVSKKILRVSETATKLSVKILWLICSFLPTEKVVDEMMVLGTVKKLLGLLQMDSRSSSLKEMVVKILKLHGGVWQQYPCFPLELRDYLRLVQGHHRG